MSFHHHKKLTQKKNHLKSLIMLNENNINSQLITNEVLKKNVFKGDWPYTKRAARKRRRDRFEEDEEEEDSLGRVSSEEEEEDSEEDSESGSQSEFEDRMAELERMEQESYVSLESGHQQGLMNEEWDISNSEDGDLGEEGYPHHDDRIIEEELIRELEN